MDDLLYDMDQDYPPEFFMDIARQILFDTFWFSPKSTRDPDGDLDEEIFRQKASTLDDFFPQFWTALDAMPQLRTFISQAMPPCRLLTTSSTAYPATAQLLHGMPHAIDSDIPIPMLEHTLLGTAVSTAVRTAITKSRHTYPLKRGPFSRFYFSDSGSRYGTLPSIQFKHIHSLFTTLTHLDMYISRPVEYKYVEALRDYIMTEKGLTHLRICFEHQNSLIHVSPNEVGAFELLFSHQKFHLPKLRFLHVSELRTEPRILLQILKRHARTLKSLRIDDNIEPQVLPKFLQLAREDRLELEQLSIVPTHTKNYHCLSVLGLPAHEYLAQEEDDLIPLQIRFNEFAFVCNLDFGWELGGWKTAVIEERHGESVFSRAYSKEEMALLDSDNRDLWYCATWPYPEPFGQDITPSRINYNESDLANTYDKVSRENASHLKHLQEAPSWRYHWDIHREIQHYSRCADDDMGPPLSTEGHESGGGSYQVPTEMWYFQHRNGEVAFGDEPLEF